MSTPSSVVRPSPSALAAQSGRPEASAPPRLGFDALTGPLDRPVLETAAAADIRLDTRVTDILAADRPYADALTGDRPVPDSAVSGPASTVDGFPEASRLFEVAPLDVAPLPTAGIGALAWLDRDAPDDVRLPTDDNDDGVVLRPVAGGLWSAATVTALGLGAVAGLAGGGFGDGGASGVRPPRADELATETGTPAQGGSGDDGGGSGGGGDGGDGGSPDPNDAPVGANVTGRHATNHDLNPIGAIAYSDAEGDPLQSITITGFDFDHEMAGQGSWTIVGERVFILQTHPTALNWWAASDRADVAGGRLAWIENDTTMDALLTAFGGHFSGSETLDQPGVYNEGGNGDATFIGLAQQDSRPTPDDEWQWLTYGGAIDWGPAFATPGHWYAGEPNDMDGIENNAENFGALIDGSGPTDRAILIDQPDSVANRRYLMEIDLPLRYADGSPVKIGDVIAAADLPGLQWAGVGLDAGSFSYTLNAASGTQSGTEYRIGFTTEAIGMLPDDANRFA